ncbi:YdbL family protein [Salidesulfovibrio onnuriiensis]|uniref:YdbL family protein n=1 Tax=Salidesulfovibrio onnuriiensis TaxID=2583823 RepID=UPI0011C9EE64|nr:YdbL family protein [Salidesulfovibrio onnuriiensis]
MRSNKLVITLVTALLCLFAASAFAGGLKERMRDRLPAIEALKAQGVVGENNKGFLEFRAAPQQADLVNAENTDRTMVYKAIAAKNGTTPDVVGKLSAPKHAAQSPAGTWVQGEGGNWSQK